MDTNAIATELAKRLDGSKRVDPEIKFTSHDGNPYLILVPQIVCADGFKMSVQASHFHYCQPRDSFGPWHQVEIGYPSEPVESFMPYIDGADSKPTETVYGYVPIELVVEAIAAHGGFAADPS